VVVWAQPPAGWGMLPQSARFTDLSGSTVQLKRGEMQWDVVTIQP
jgi:hypothetical protein